MAIRYEIEKHAVAFPSKLLAQNGGKQIGRHTSELQSP